MLEKEAISEVDPSILEENCFYSPVFFVLKKNGPVIDCQDLNANIAKNHFKMESILTVKHLLQPGDWMIVIDLKDAYFHVAIRNGDRNYLRFIQKSDNRKS